MNRYLAICIATLLSVACCRQSSAQPAELEKGGIIIDVRTAGEFKRGHLANAIHIPYEKIVDRIGQHAKAKTDRIVLYCLSGHRSEVAKKALQKAGYTAVVNAGSYDELKATVEKGAQEGK